MRSLFKFRDVTPLDREDLLMSSWPQFALWRGIKTPADVLEGYASVFAGRELGTGIIFQVDSSKRVRAGLWGSHFIPEQMYLCWDPLMEEWIQGNLIYIHSHDETHTTYLEGIQSIEGAFQHELFPTDEDLAFAQELQDHGASVECYLIGELGVLRFWPPWSIAMENLMLPPFQVESMVAQLREAYAYKGWSLTPPS